MNFLNTLCVLALANPVISAVVQPPAPGSYRPDISADFSNPFTSPLNRIAGIALGVSLILMVIFLIAAVVLFIIGKVFHQGKAQEKGLSIVLWGFAGAIALVSLSGLVFWLTSDFKIA